MKSYWEQLDQEYQRWHAYAQAHPEEPQAYVRRGMAQFKLGRIAESIQDFDQAEALDTGLRPHLWQRGLAYYYAGRLEDGVAQFEINLSVIDHDAEETIWRFLCQAQLKDVAYARASLIPVREDSRMIIRAVHDLYAGVLTKDDLVLIGQREGQQAQFYAALYLGLYAEAEKDPDTARHWMTEAVLNRQPNDYMWSLAVVHQTLRGLIIH